MRLAWALVLLAAGCSKDPSADFPIDLSKPLPYDLDLRRVEGQTVILRGYVRAVREKGHPKIYEKGLAEPFFLVSYAEGVRPDPYLDRRVEVRGKVVRFGPSSHSEGGLPAQGYPDAIHVVTGATIRELP